MQIYNIISDFLNNYASYLFSRHISLLLLVDLQIIISTFYIQKINNF